MTNHGVHYQLTPKAVARIPEQDWQDFRPGVSLYPLQGKRRAPRASPYSVTSPAPGYRPTPICGSSTSW